MKNKIIKSVYLKKDVARAIQKEAERQERPFSYIASGILEQWVNDKKREEKK